MVGHPFIFSLKIKDITAGRIMDEKPIICSKKKSICCQERFEKYCGSILVLSILDTEVQ
jgi:hypothetical protein